MPAAAKGPKRRRGCPAVASRLQRSHPRTPVYGGYPYILPQKFRRAKYGSGVLFLPGHRALMQCKISACSISPPRLVPTSRGRGRRVGDASIGTAPKTGNGRASVPPLRYEKKVLLQRNDGRGKPLPCGMGGQASLSGGRANHSRTGWWAGLSTPGRRREGGEKAKQPETCIHRAGPWLFCYVKIM